MSIEATVSEIENTSGKGPDAIVPQEITDHFNWGAFLFTWIWGFGNKTFLPLIILPVSFIPIVNIFAPLGLAIWFGMQGNEWAWRNKQFDSIEEFHEYQKSWVKVWLILFIMYFVISIMIITGIIVYFAYSLKSV